MRRTPPTDDHSAPAPEPRDERMATLRSQQLLAELAARAEMERGDSPYYVDERVVGWLAREVSSPHRSSDGWSAARVRSAATRLRARAEAARLKVRLVAGPPPVERAVAPGMIADVLDVARAMRAAPRLDLGAAAGLGRDLWDEPCEQWVRVPDDAPAGSYVSLRVVGESMDPLLHTGDSVLVQVGGKVARDTVVLARLPDAGYVVKKVGKVTRAQLELQSLNDAFPPIVVPRDERTIVGTVVLRWCPHGVQV
ncbi:MAG: helix-turn-helix transcriptional regulator [Gemmatimonadaceae bacterium]